MQTCGTKKRREASLDRYGYSMEKDPMFNGEHASLEYDGIGPDPCDHHNMRLWFLNPGFGKPPVRLGRGMRHR